MSNGLVVPNNVVEGGLLETSLDEVLDYVTTLLLSHNGPLSGMAAVYERSMSGGVTTKFTKDGINVLNSIHYADPVKEYVLELLRYVGKGLDAAAGDGTTSSILVAIAMINAGRRSRASVDLEEAKRGEYATSNPQDVMPYIQYGKYVQCYSDMVERIKIELPNHAIVPDKTDHELIRAIAFNQAMTSSHGDEVLSKLVVEMVDSLPIKALSHITYRRESVETSQIYRLEYDTSDFKTRVSITDARMCNSPLGDRIQYDGATLVASSYELINNSTQYLALVEILTNWEPDHGALVILAPTPNSSVSSELYTLYQDKRQDGCSIAMLWMPAPAIVRCTPANLLFATAGVDAINTDPDLLVLEEVGVDYSAGIVKLHNIATYDNLGVNVDLQNTSSALSKFIFILDQNMEHYMGAVEHVNHKDIVNKLSEMRNTAEFNNIASIVIGGQVYDAKTAKDVLEDVLKAVKESLLNGCVLGGWKGLSAAVDALVPAANPSEDIETVEASLKTCLDWFKKELSPANTDNAKSFDLVTHEECAFDAENIKTTRPIVQSTTSCIEFLKRLGDILPKIIYMNRMIIPDMID